MNVCKFIVISDLQNVYTTQMGSNGISIQNKVGSNGMYVHV